APVPLLACLKHPLAGLGGEPARLRADIRRLERHVLRGPRPAPGTAGLRAALGEAKAELEARGWPVRELAGLEDLLARLERAVAPLADLAAGGAAPFDALIRAHIVAA